MSSDALAAASEACPSSSFDVFDTVLTRRIGRPDAVFDLVADRLTSEGSLTAPRAAFIAARRRAEPTLHSLHRRPPSLQQVYAEVVRVLSLPDSDAEHFAATEQAVERHVCVPVPGVAAIVSSARAASRDGRLIFVSDTPHTGAFLRELLMTHGLCTARDHVFTSADAGASKSRGGLFTVVARELGLTPRDLRHCGDNAWADVAAAHAEGWQAVLRPQAQMNRYEHLLDGGVLETEGMGSWLAGASRLARLEAEERGVAAPVAAVAAGVIAPVLFGYALWIAAQARQRGITRLYFVARDGETLMQVAAPVLAVLAPEVECRYLYGSRHAWIRAGISLSEDQLPTWLAPKHDSTLRTALLRAGLDVGVDLGIDSPWAQPEAADRRLPRPAARELSRRLQQEPLRSMVLSAAQEDGRNALEYLRQEGFAQDGRSALVDLGWRGHSAQAFDHLVRHLGGPSVDHFFMGLYAGVREVRESPAAPSVSAWLFDRDQRLAPDVRHLKRPNVLMETFCAGTEGRVLRYRREGETVVPELAEPTNARVLDWGLLEVRQVIQDVVGRCVGALDERHLHVDLRKTSWDVLQAFWMRPTPAEARAWGTFPWEEESYPPEYPIAQDLSHTEIVTRFVARRGKVLPFNSWRAGSAELQRQPWRAVFKLVRRAQEQRPRLRRWRRRLSTLV